MSDNETGSFFTGVIVGAVVGVALGLLFAPQSGKETRELVKTKAVQAKEKASELIGKMKGAAAAES
jgi:gas vesicle protein